MTIEKLNPATPDIAAQNVARIAELFPECVTEGPWGTASDAGGPVIDFDLLRQALSNHLVEGPQERYRLDWPGKREALLAANTPIDKTLRPMRDDSVDFDTTRNLFIEGDNLDALKLLQETYLGTVKMIYIDPPYNTGKDFIYKDSFAQSREMYEADSGQRNAEGGRLVANPETNGRFHSDWLSMIHPRLKLARNLLRDDGVIMISIDDNELYNLRIVTDQVFGSDNYVATLVWEKTRKNDAKLFSQGHEYILVYAKSRSFLRSLGVKWREAKPGAKEIQEEYLKLKGQFGSKYGAIEKGLAAFYSSLPRDNAARRLSRYKRVDSKGVWRDDNMSWPGGGGPNYDVPHPDTGKACLVPEGGWRYATRKKMDEMIALGKVEFRSDHTETPIRKTYLIADSDDDVREEDGGAGIQVAGTYFYRSALQATTVMSDLFPEGEVFDYPKDVDVIGRWIGYICGSDKNAIVLDFFSGSGTTGHAVIQLNASDNGNRAFVAVQLPEPIEQKSRPVAYAFCKSNRLATNVASISRERMRRAGAAVRKDNPGAADSLDTGFRAFRIDSGNLDDTRLTPAEATQAALSGMISHIKDDRSDEDLLFGALLRWGVDITMPIARRELLGRTVWLVDPPAEGKTGAALIACFAKAFDGKGGIDTEFADALGVLAPLRVLFRDDGFASDAVKENVASRLKQRAPDTAVRVL